MTRSQDEDLDSICENCCRPIPSSEVQQCEICGMDGLGDCCIGDLDHACEKEKESQET